MPSEDYWMDLIGKLSKTVPTDMTWEGAIHALVTLLETATLTEKEQAVITGIAAMMYRQDFQEMQATLTTASIINKANKH